ncbi:MAG TPA: sigma-70 family RNA polymerase sigma factor [Solirubrobacteraceae bacterium]|nr:sigma-70 family RNA polymerase sigma factor [Solirubrobacteraceae bacterium]
MADPRNRPRPETNYAELAPRLQAIVAHNIRAPQALIEDACQIAWSQWVTHRDRVSPNSVLAWLATTAIREALRLIRQESRHVPLAEGLEAGGRVINLPIRAPGPEQLVEFREQLAEVRRLPVRQQRALLMQGFGYDYREIAAQTGATRRTVERNLLRARQGLEQARRSEPK